MHILGHLDILSIVAVHNPPGNTRTTIMYNIPKKTTYWMLDQHPISVTDVELLLFNPTTTATHSIVREW